MQRLSCSKVYVFLVLLYSNYSGATNFSQCLVDLTTCATNPTNQNCPLNISNTTALSILRTSGGFPIADASELNSTGTATAISFAGCAQYCGNGPALSSWKKVFPQAFSAWLLPYLALLSQLPFGARRRTDNLMSVVLTLGSPTLAGYSLYITLLNARWLNDHLFSGIEYPSVAVRRSVVQVLNNLQQVPLRIHPGRSGRFESLVIRPENDQWWLTLSRELNYSYMWSIASATSIAWVVIAYILTAADSFSSLEQQNDSTGQGSVSIWVWLIPIVIGWLVLSPKCDHDRVNKAYDKANRYVFVPDLHDPSADLTHVSFNFGLTISPSLDWEYYSNMNITSPDEFRTPAVFNYARVLSWSRTVYLTSLYYRTAWRKWNHREGFDGQPIRDHVRGDVPPESRLGNLDQITRHFHPVDREAAGANILWLRSVCFNMMVASLMSLQLQWATTGAAILAAWYTPTTGLGCRSLAYLIYGTISTMVWILLVLSNALGYYAHNLMLDSSTPNLESNGKRTLSLRRRVSASTGIGYTDSSSVAIPMLDMAAPFDDVEADAIPGTNVVDVRLAQTISRLADWLRWIGKSFAIVNAIIIIANSVLQYTGVYDNCYCDSSVFSRGWHSAFKTAAYSPSDVTVATRAWIGAQAVALIPSMFFVGVIYFLRDSLPV